MFFRRAPRKSAFAVWATLLKEIKSINQSINQTNAVRNVIRHRVNVALFSNS